MKVTNNIYTIGFTHKTAEDFFTILKKSGTSTLIDVRLNNTSQLAGFSKYPDIRFFLEQICNIKYIHDIKFAPEESTLSLYKKKQINWDEYVVQFEATMEKRKITDYISKNYNISDNICLLCSEPVADNCHRRLIAEKFVEVYPNKHITHL